MIQREKRKRVLRIFLSAAMVDHKYVNKLRSLLSQRSNVRIFTTSDILIAGERWESALRKVLSKCDIFLVLLSPNSVNSASVLFEVGVAWGIGKLVIAVVTDPEILHRRSSLSLLENIEYIKIEDFEKPEVINHILERYEEAATSH